MTELTPLNLPEYQFRFRSSGVKEEIFDPVRKKFIVLTPEEWVRQNIVQYLINSLNVPQSLMVIEKSLVLNRMKKRADVLIYNFSGEPLMIVECKAPGVRITQKTFDQVARYNMVFKVKFLLVTNGLEHFICTVNFNDSTYSFLTQIPDYAQMKN